MAKSQSSPCIVDSDMVTEVSEALSSSGSDIEYGECLACFVSFWRPSGRLLYPSRRPHTLAYVAHVLNILKAESMCPDLRRAQR